MAEGASMGFCPPDVGVCPGCEEVNLDRPDKIQLQAYFLKMAEQTSRDWEDIGIYLHLPTELLKGIKMEFTDGVQMDRSRQVLQAWCKSEKQGPTPHKLMEVLREMKRNDVIMHMEDTMEEYRKYCRRVSHHSVQEQDQSASLQQSPPPSPPPPPQQQQQQQQQQPHCSPTEHPQPCGEVPRRPPGPGLTLYTPDIHPVNQPGSLPSVSDTMQPHPHMGTHEGGGVVQSIGAAGSMPSVSVDGIREGVQNMHVGHDISSTPVNTMSHDNDVDVTGELSLPSNLSGDG